MRGGGSLEDLWAFNEEVLADAVFKSRIPVVSAVGHEIDFTICDFTADLRVPTPSGAAEAIIPEKTALLKEISMLAGRMSAAASIRCERAQLKLEQLQSSPVLRESAYMIMERMQLVDSYTIQAENLLKNAVVEAGYNLSNVEAKLEMLSPYHALKRGYALLLAQTNSQPVTSIANVKIGDKLTAVLADGKLNLTVTESD